MRTTRMMLAAAALALAAACSEKDAPTTPAPEDLSALGERGRAEGYDLLLVTFDTTRADHLSCYGYGEKTTPVVDALCAHGLRFAQAIAPVPVTLPSHATLLTGQLPPTHGARDNGQTLGEGAVTLAERLKGQGYATAAFVSAYVLDERFGLAQGFDVYDDDIQPVAGQQVGFVQRTGDVTTTAALRWLDGATERQDQRFFLWVHCFDPHFVYQPPAPYSERFENPYDGEIAFADAQLGRLVERLRERGRLDRTLIVLTSDHGEGLGEHSEAQHSLLIYDTTMHVPLVLSCPSLFEQGLVVQDRVVGLADVYPTVLDLLGVVHNGAIDGINVLLTPRDVDRALYIETMSPRLMMGWSSLHGLRRLGDKLIFGPDPEYYDLETDPHELDNLYAGSPEAASLQARLKHVMGQWKPVEDVAIEEPELDPEVARRLAALGYVRGNSHHETGKRKDPKSMMEQLVRSDRARRLLAEPRMHGKALEDIQWCLETDPDNAHFWGIAARVYAAMGRLEHAQAAARNSIRIRPDARIQALLGMILFDQRKNREALAAWDEGEKLDPLCGEVYLTRAVAFARAGALPKAIAQAEKALEVDPVASGLQARQILAQLQARLREAKRQ